MARVVRLAMAVAATLLAVAPPVRADEPQSVTFSEAVSIALAHHPAAAVARAGVQAADAQRRQVRSSALPTLTGNALYTQLDGDRTLNARVLQGQEALGANLLLSAPLLAANRWGAWRRAADAVEVATAGARSTDRDVALAAGRAYLTVLLSRRALDVTRVARDTARQHLAFAEKRFGGGVGTRLDVVRASQELESTETLVAAAEVQAVRAREALGVTLGVDHAVDAQDEPSFAAPARGGTGLEGRADIVFAGRARWAAERGNRDGWRDYLPTLSANFQPFYQNPATPTLPEWGWQAQVALTLPLYDGGLRYGQALERAAGLAAARARYDLAVRQAHADERTAHAAAGGADVALGKARAAARLAHEAAELAKVAYTEGASTNLELIDADRRALDADEQVALAEDAVRQAQLEELAAAGQFP